MLSRFHRILFLTIFLSCSAVGDKPEEYQEGPQNPQYSSLLGHFIALTDSNTLVALADAVRVLMKTNQLRELVDALDVAIKSVGGSNLKKILIEVLKDPSTRELLKADGPVAKLLQYPDIEKSLDTLHILNRNGAVHNGLIPLIRIAYDSPLLTDFYDAVSFLLEEGYIQEAIGIIEGVTKEKVEIKQSGISKKVPSTVPLNIALTYILEKDAAEGMVINTVELLRYDSVKNLIAILGIEVRKIGEDENRAKRIFNKIGEVVGLIDRSHIEAIRKIVKNFMISSINIKEKDGNVQQINLLDKLYKIIGEDGKGGYAIINFLRSLGREEINNIGPSLAIFFERHCEDGVPTSTVESQKYSCFMQMIRMVNSTYQKETVLDEESRKLGAEILGPICTKHLKEGDPLFEDLHKGYPKIPIFPQNTAVAYHLELAKRTPEQASGFTSYINCLLHNKLGDIPMYEKLGFSWDVDVEGFAALDAIGKSGFFNFYVGLLNVLNNMPDKSSRVREIADIVAMMWGTDGQEINPLYNLLKTAFNFPDKNSSLVVEFTEIINDLLSLKYNFDEKEKFAAENVILALSDLLNPQTDIKNNVLTYYYNSLTPDIDESIETTIPAIKNILIKPEYRAYKILHLLGAALTRTKDKITFIDYIDKTSIHYRPKFTEEVSELYKLALPSLRLLSKYFSNYDNEGELMNLLGYAISCGAVNDALNTLANSRKYDPDYIFLDFLKRFNEKNGIAIVADMIDAIHQYDIIHNTLEVLKVLFKYDAINELILFLYYFLPNINLGEG
ncbi:MAG: hypothetical protein N2746_06375 [Deltaproteobacteria bacterium]|nr:hypothetical protein [Deltaproteobacteria bacterium]